jgi:serine/threonine protein kinase
MPELHREAEVVFFAALDCATAAERAAFVEGACATRPELLQRVRELLAAHNESKGPLDVRPPGLGATVNEGPVTEAAGTVIGPYKLLEQIGEGGFGVVFMAEQQEPIRRKVALKVLKPGMDSKQVIARFEAERQALALMDHPNIAKVLEAGQTGSGRPYFVMDLVKGLPITAYCDQRQLTTRERLELFLHVCLAVQHAHQKGIIHRDLKPSNVLVTQQDGALLAKVIDFGIAKAVGQQLTDKTLFTGFAQLIGSPLYMSPEQAALSNVDVDTRSDIYSLGVVLYELLTGTTPFDKDRFQGTSYEEMRRIIREEEPPRPSTRISTLGQAATTISEQRKTDPRRLSQLFRGELDWIVMKCLEKDRNRRYETASALAADVQRYLQDEPVQACPPSVFYRCRKFARRNRVVMAITGCVLAALAIGSGLATWQWRLAESRRLQADKSAAIAQAINQFFVKDLLGAASPEEALGKKLTVEEVLDKAAKKVGSAFPNQPEVEASVRMAIAETYVNLGLYSKAEPHVHNALELRAGTLGDEHPDTLDCVDLMGTVLAWQERQAGAEVLLREALVTARRALGDEHPSTLSLLRTHARVLSELGRFPEAEAIARQYLAAQRSIRGPKDEETLLAMQSLSEVSRCGRQVGRSRAACPSLFGPRQRDSSGGSPDGHDGKGRPGLRPDLGGENARTGAAGSRESRGRDPRVGT